MRFRATLLLGGRTATGIEVPEEVVTALGPGTNHKVAVTLRQHRFRTTLARRNGVAMLPVSAEVRAAAGVEAGEVLDVDIELDTAPRVVDVPDDLAAALAASPAAQAFYDGLAPSHRKEWARWITEAKRPETRQGRVARTVEALLEGRKQR